VYREAEEVFEAAGVKLDAAFNRMLDEADRLPTPSSKSSDFGRPGHLAAAAETTFAGTRYREANVGRARQLGERWEAEHAEIMRARQELYDKLAVEADAAWPAILAATGASTDFDPSDTDARGKVVLLQGVHNRSGWEFDGYGFS